MNFNRLLMAAALMLAPASLAEAYRNPTPPPSGITVHLFGPNSILSNLVPGETPAHPAQGAAAPADGTAAGTAPGNTDNMNTSTDPGAGSILHQMFVVGDPNDPTTPSTGRTGERQSAQ